MTKKMPAHFNSIAVHGGLIQPGVTRAASPPLERAASWSPETMAELDDLFEGTAAGFYYGRDRSPTPALLEQTLSDLQEGRFTVAYATGMAAIAGVLSIAGQGKRVLATPELYGKTYHLIQTWLPKSGAEIRFVSGQNQQAIFHHLKTWQPDLMVVETLSNPLVKVSDIGWLVEQAKAAECKIMVDNTFASPYLSRPSSLGADYTVESLTKYINGHGDVMGGSVTVLDAIEYRALIQQRSAFGATLDPQAAWLTLRGLRTLGLRMERQCANAAALASYLAAHAAVQQVHYPGLESDPDHATAQELFAKRGYGGMLAFELTEPSWQRVWQVMDKLQMALRAPTLGDITTMVSYPAQASHRALSAEQRAAVGISAGLIRVSVGIEAIEDIIADFEQALQ